MTQMRAGTPRSRSSSMPALIELSFTAGTQIRTTDLTIQIPSYYQCASEPRYYRVKTSLFNQILNTLLLKNMFTFEITRINCNFEAAIYAKCHDLC